MSVLKSEIRRGTYVDSIVLMQLQSDLARQPDIADAGVIMGTSANLELLRAIDLLPAEIEGVGAEDLVVVVRAASPGAARAALAKVDGLLARRPAVAGEEFQPRSLATAVRQLPAAAWVLISIPGRFATGVARQALALGRHVFLYSDNVELQEEAALKREAAERGLLVMGPDCGTALINGVGFGFANRVRRGAVGLVCASGTGLQAIAARVHELGAGVSHAIGTGGRDLHAEVGGITARQGLDLLARDSATRVLVLASKPPDRGIGADLLAAAMQLDLPVVVYFSGVPFPGSRLGNLHFARSLDDAAELAVRLAAGDSGGEGAPPVRERGARAGWVRGLFAGGTLALEAVHGLAAFLAPLHSNLAAAGAHPLPSAADSRGHTVIDFGTDELTVGRLHPMLDQQLRLQRLRQEAANPEVGSILLDVVLGSGAHPDPAAELAPAIAECKTGPDLEFVAVVIGTDEDPQDLPSTVERLTAAGAIVYRTVSDAVGHLVRRHSRPAPALPSPVALEAIDAPVAILNVGLAKFYDDLVDQQVPAVQVDWRPPAGGNEKLMAILERMRT